MNGGKGGVLAEVILDLGSGSDGSEQVDMNTPGGGQGCSQVLEAYIQAVIVQSPGSLRSARPVVSKYPGCVLIGPCSSPLDRVIVQTWITEASDVEEICPSFGWQLGTTQHYWQPHQ